MRYAILNNDNVVVNIALSEAPLADNWIASETAAIGDIYEDGQFIKPPAPPPQVPDSCTALAGMLALDAAGMSDAYETWANDPERTFAERAFINKALTWRRDDPVLLAGADALGLTESQLDELFIAASQL